MRTIKGKITKVSFTEEYFRLFHPELFKEKVEFT